MSRKFKIHDSAELYFVTFTVVRWVDVFTRTDTRNILLDSLRYCQENKGLEIYAWCLMTNHIHLIVSSKGEEALSGIIRDCKAFTSRHIRKELESNVQESRRDWMLYLFERAGTHNPNNKDFQLWQQHNHPIHLYSRELITRCLRYIHYNPVAAGFVAEPEHWLWSSALDYAGGKGFLDVLILE